jgi:membrane protease YdiL (CAAX protease family)
MATPEHPFNFLKARVVVLLFTAISLVMTLLISTLGALELLPMQPDDPILVPILYMLIFICCCWVLMLITRQPRLRLADLVGEWPQHLAWPRLLWLVVGLFLFSLGAFQVSYLLLSLLMPALVESTLEQSLLSIDQTASPGLYNGLILFSVLVVAPITEEFIFRGILLHRWAMKWGVRPAILLTSVLFGVLHSNLIGLFVFGVVMSLLYISTRSLLVPIAAHAANNAIASSIEYLTIRSQNTINVDTLAEFRSSWWLGVLCLAASAPWVVRYIRRHWPSAKIQLPYFANQLQRQLGNNSTQA